MIELNTIKQRIEKYKNKIATSYKLYIKKISIGFSLAILVLSNIFFPSTDGNIHLNILKWILGLVTVIVLFSFIGKQLLKDSYEISYMILIFLSFAPLLTYIVCKSFQIPKNEIVGTVDAWIGFAGSIIGGAITLLTLYATLLHQRNSSNRSQYYECLPVIQAFPRSHFRNGEILNYFEHCLTIDSVKNEIDEPYILRIDNCILKNIGNGIATNININQISVEVHNDEFQYYQIANYFPSYKASLSAVSEKNEYISRICYEIPINEQKNLMLKTLYIHKKNKKKIYAYFRVTMFLSFKNRNGNNVYQILRIFCNDASIETRKDSIVFELNTHKFVSEIVLDSNPTF